MTQLSSLDTPYHGLADRWAWFERLAQHLGGSERITALVLGLAIAVALLAPLGPLTSNRFHGDEAIYSSWGLDIASGRDVLISGSPVDKPPLFFYLQALFFLFFGPTEVAARLPSLVANVISVGLIFELGRSLYGRSVGLVAAFLLAASPFAILFAPTAFTDPVMVAWVLAGCLAASRAHWVWAGVFLGMGAITKQQGMFFVPLALGLGLVSSCHVPPGAPRSTKTVGQQAGRLARRSPLGKSLPHTGYFQGSRWRRAKGEGEGPDCGSVGRLRHQVLVFGVAFLAVWGLALAWDIARARQPGFMAQSLISYGGLSWTAGSAWGRWLGFWRLLQYGTGSPPLNVVLLAGTPLLLAVDGLGWMGRASFSTGRARALQLRVQTGADVVLVVFIALFLIGHSLFAFEVWDRYLLGLVPLMALLLARVLTLPRRVLGNRSFASVLGVLFVAAMLCFTLRPIQDAATSRFPIGGDHGAYQGIEQVANYLRGVPSDTTLYHRWLGWHWRFYLWGNHYDLRAWTSPDDLAAQALARPGARRYIVFPSWRSSIEARLALAEAGLELQEVERAFREDGTLSFTIYRIQESP
ncbi:MAG: hypothetical protein Kow0063_27590 [Anaerolineae bacterium]